MKTMTLEDFARDQTCTVRVSGICKQDRLTTVLAHLRRAHMAGMSEKPSSLAAVHACFDCHNLIDNRDLSDRRKALRDAMIVSGTFDTTLLEALCRTLGRVEAHRDELRW